MPPEQGEVRTGYAPSPTATASPSPAFATSLASFGLLSTPTGVSSPTLAASSSSSSASSSRHFRSNSNATDGLPSPGSSMDAAAASALAREGYPLLLRRATAGASGSIMRFRRGSMLGNELRPGEVGRNGEDRERGDARWDKGRRRDIDKRASSPSPNPRRSPPDSTSSRMRRRSRSFSSEAFILDGDESMEVDKGHHERAPRTPPHSETSFDSPSLGSTTSAYPLLGSSPIGGTPLRGPSSFRRGASRRGPLTPRDKSVLRVAATLQDESAPGDSEVASEAKLQRRLGDLSFPSSPLPGAQNGRPRVPIFGIHRPPGTSGSAPWTRDEDDEDVLLSKDGRTNASDDGYPSSSEGSPPAHPSTDLPDIDEVEMLDGSTGSMLGTSTPNSSAPNLRMSAIWTGIRDGKNRASPGADRTHRARTPGTSIVASANVSPIALTGGSTPFHTATPDADSSMEAVGLPSTAAATLSYARQTTPAAISPVLWATRGTSSTSVNVSKRKHADERFEPYASSVHKRRAVSPMTLLTLSHSHSAHAHAHLVARGGTPSPIGVSAPSSISMLSSALRSPSLLAQHSSTGAGPSSGTNLPTPTPLSMPSPTLGQYSSLSTTPLGAPMGAAQHYFASVHHHGHHSRSSSGSVGLGGSTPWPINTSAVVTRSHDSPITRPSTPTGAVPSMPLSIGGGPGPSPSLLATSAGSGPGYGSGALGLSLSGNAKAGPLARRRRAQTPAGTSAKEVDVNGRSAVGWAAAGDSDDEEGEEMDEGVRMLGLE